MTLGEALTMRAADQDELSRRIMAKHIIETWPELWWATLITNDPTDNHSLQIAVIEPLTKKEDS